MQNHEEISAKYQALLERTVHLEERLAASELKKGRRRHGIFYLLLLLCVCINYVASSCSFTIGRFTFNGFKDWGGSIALLIAQMLFLFIFGVRSDITHLSTFVDKIARIRNGKENE